MQAKETKFQELIEGTKQFVVPLYQRVYSWQEKEWTTLLNDIKEIYETEIPRPHFIGSIVTIPTISVPEGVAKFLLIDGQQRITTIFILLTVIKDLCQNDGSSLSDEITNTLLVNQYKKGLDYYKLLPTQLDREAFEGLLKNERIDDSLITKAYNFFKKQIQKNNLNCEKLKNLITNYFSTVSIVLDPNDNPYLVFESLNAKGRKLEQADLIRNYFLMVIHVKEQEEIYNKFWLPTQTLLKESLTEFIRHYLMRNGGNVKQSDVYFEIKNKVTSQNVKVYLQEINKFAAYYDKLLNPKNETNTAIQKYLSRLNKFEVTTAYPLLLYFYNEYSINKISEKEFIELLQTLENYLVRRFICDYPSNQLNKIFGAIQPILANSTCITIKFKEILQSKKYPTDDEFITRFSEKVFYGGDKISKTTFILEAIEDSYSHKEFVSNDKLTIEHIMPQKLTEEWKHHLGEQWETIYNLYIHNIGNLTITGYNSELSNKTYEDKKVMLNESHLELNKYFSKISTWNDEAIIERNKYLCERALLIWPFFGDKTKIIKKIDNITNTKPIYLLMLGQRIKVDSWRDVLIKTLEIIDELSHDEFLKITKSELSKYITKNKDKLRNYRQLKNGYYTEVNLNANDTRRLCYKLIAQLDLTTEDWEVEVI